MQGGENAKKKILVTGFGPFGKHVINPSWEAVKELNELCVNSEELRDVLVITKEIPVIYQYVDKVIPKLWEEHNFEFAIHVGVLTKGTFLKLEYQAHGTGYVKTDVTNCIPHQQHTPHVLQTKVDVKELCRMINENTEEGGCKVTVSLDAGRYLCEYIFYRSLSIKPEGTLFLHVPDFQTHTSKQLARVLLNIICLLLKHKND